MHEIGTHVRALWKIVTRRWFAKANRAIASARVPDAPRTEAWNSVVMREYTPQSFRAPIVHFLGDDVPVDATVLNDRRLGWQDFARSGFETRRVPGDHVSMLAEGNAPALADALEQVLMSVRPDLPVRVAKMSAGS